MIRVSCSIMGLLSLLLGCNSGDKVGHIAISGIEEFGEIKTTRFVRPLEFSGYFIDAENLSLQADAIANDNITISTRRLDCSEDNSMFQEWSQLSKAVVDAAEEDGSLGNACDEISALVAFKDAQATDAVYPHQSLSFLIDDFPANGNLETGRYGANGSYANRVEASWRYYKWDVENCEFTYSDTNVETGNEYFSLSGEMEIDQTNPVIGYFDGVMEELYTMNQLQLTVEFELTTCVLDAFDTLVF